MKIPLVSGRFFNEQDTKESMKVLIIDQHMAREYFADEDPVGRRIKLGDSDSPWMTIVGVVGNVKQYALDADSRVALYAPLEQNLSSAMYVVVRTAGDPGALAPAITSEARDMDPNLAVFDVKPMEQRVSESLARRRFAMFALGLFAAVAMILAMVGIYGVMAYLVTQRTHEIGIRMALGARSADVLSMVVIRGMRLALAGLAIGLGGAYLATSAMASLVFGVSTTDPVTFGLVSLILAGVALAACFIPARRAARVDPMIALRYE
jgi:putative ABC transport system permease protein